MFFGNIGSGTSTGVGSDDIFIASYSNTTFPKVARAKGAIFFSGSSTTANYSNNLDNLWTGTAAISSISCSPSGGNFAVGTSFVVYGTN